ncbi:MAG: DUF255 domain-containing protein [Thermoanaerobaculia bacterium]
MSDGTTARTNRLAGESSPYLLLHARNPVDWYPWGPEALEKARREDKPIFLSVGYSTCFWCHVMERESFSDPSVAALMNDEFVNIKVDREERLDLDEVYMLATQVLAGQGGWPNSVFLTPDLKPFFAGTYFPPLDARGLPGFPTVLRSMIHAWKERRADVETQGDELATAIRRHLAEIEPYAGPLPGTGPATRALASLRERFDGTWGGFGGAPKFPTPSNLLHLLAFADDSVEASMMLTATLDGMARGGIFDQLAGGFHRYATDREWRVPHFEKMLYDNGLLLEVYAREHARSGSEEAARIARATAAFLAREMTAPDGAFWSAIDAETGGREGAYYVWTRDELDLALGREGATFLAPIYGFHEEPFFEEERYVLHLPRALDVQARERRTSREALLAEIEPLREKLLTVRSRRRRPATDDKILADWNGIAIAGLAVAGAALGDEALLAAAGRAADFVLATLRTEDGTLLHAWRAGRGRIAAGLSDYAFLVRGLLRLHEATGEPRWLAEAVRLADEQESRLASPRGGYFNVAEAPDLLVRGKEIFDGALPGANGVAARNQLDLHEATGDARWRERAERTARAFAPLVDQHPEGAKTMSLALAELGGEEGAEPAPRTPPAAAESGTVQIGGGSASLRREALGVVEAEPVPGGDADPESGWRPFRLELAIADGWHLDADAVRIDGAGLEVGEIALPAAASFGEGELAQRAFTGRIGIALRARALDGAAAPTLRLSYRACDERRCLPEVTREMPLPG